MTSVRGFLRDLPLADLVTDVGGAAALVILLLSGLALPSLL